MKKLYFFVLMSFILIFGNKPISAQDENDDMFGVYVGIYGFGEAGESNGLSHIMHPQPLARFVNNINISLTSRGMFVPKRWLAWGVSFNLFKTYEPISDEVFSIMQNGFPIQKIETNYELNGMSFMLDGYFFPAAKSWDFDHVYVLGGLGVMTIEQHEYLTNNQIVTKDFYTQGDASFIAKMGIGVVFTASDKSSLRASFSRYHFFNDIELQHSVYDQDDNGIISTRRVNTHITDILVNIMYGYHF